MSFTETKTTAAASAASVQQKNENQKTTVSQIEEKLQLKLENSKSFLFKLYDQCQLYWDAIKSNFEIFWQYQEFRLSVYIFGLLSAIPAAIFLLVITLVIFSTSVLVSFIWTFFVFSTITIGLIILVPILAGFSIIAAFFIVGYYIYKYLLQLKQASNNSSDSNIKKSVKTN